MWYLDRVYIVGGFNGTECMNTAECYNPDTNQWTGIAPMRSRRSGIGIIAHRNQIFAIGKPKVLFDTRDTVTARVKVMKCFNDLFAGHLVCQESFWLVLFVFRWLQWRGEDEHRREVGCKAQHLDTYFRNVQSKKQLCYRSKLVSANAVTNPFTPYLQLTSTKFTVISNCSKFGKSNCILSPVRGIGLIWRINSKESDKPLNFLYLQIRQ